MKILFINGSPEREGNTARLANVLLEGHQFETLEIADMKIYDYGQHFEDDQFNEALERMNAADVLVFGSPVYWHDLSGMLRNLLDRCYGPVPEGGFAGKRLFFLFQGAAPTPAMLDRGEYTMSRFAGLYGATYEGMATNDREARELAAKL
ncbi:MAG: NAD(P)H-dependent oxidoreductase [Eggerthellaceae bacterium]|nr:NAD(P)H-dependent oxidoreductase [Eggerthellaceae bacterium]